MKVSLASWWSHSVLSITKYLPFMPPPDLFPLLLCSNLPPVTIYHYSLCSDPQYSSLISYHFPVPLCVPGPHRWRACTLNSPLFSTQVLPVLVQLTWVSYSMCMPQLCYSWVVWISCEMILVHPIYFLIAYFAPCMGGVSQTPHVSHHQTQDSMRACGEQEKKESKDLEMQYLSISLMHWFSILLGQPPPKSHRPFV